MAYQFIKLIQAFDSNYVDLRVFGLAGVMQERIRYKK
jgi:hypothetical protein